MKTQRSTLLGIALASVVLSAWSGNASANVCSTEGGGLEKDAAGTLLDDTASSRKRPVEEEFAEIDGALKQLKEDAALKELLGKSGAKDAVARAEETFGKKGDRSPADAESAEYVAKMWREKKDNAEFRKKLLEAFISCFGGK